MAGKVFDCDDLANLFDDTGTDYDLSYIKEFLCGDDGFWDIPKIGTIMSGTVT